MAIFSYSAKDKDGKIVRGTVEAKDKKAAVSLIQKEGSTPFIVNEEKDLKLKLKNILTSSVSRVSLKDKLVFCEQMSTLVNSGVPLAQALAAVKDQSKGTMSKVVEHIYNEVESGQSLAGALETEKKHFSPVFINMVKAGEASGKLDSTLNDLAVQVQKDYELVSKIRGALTYPTVIVVAMIAAVIFLMVKVVPAISGFFDELGAKLPLPTRILIAISSGLTHYGIYLALGVVFLIVGLYYAFKKVEILRRGLHTVILKSPVIGNIATKFNIARFSRTLGSLLGSGVGVLESLDIVSRSTKNMVFNREVKGVAEKVKNGVGLTDAMKQSKAFPIMVTQMVSIGEETGNINKMMIKVSEHYERQIDNLTKNISSIIEPIIMLLVGTGIGFIIVSIILPIYKATQTLGG